MVFDTLDQLEMYIPVLPSIRLIADIMDHDDLYDMAPGSYKTKDSKVTYNIRLTSRERGRINNVSSVYSPRGYAGHSSSLRFNG